MKKTVKPVPEDRAATPAEIEAAVNELSDADWYRLSAETGEGHQQVRPGAVDDMETKNEVETLRLNNRRLEDEIQRLRPLARLAEVIALMEASNHRQFDELVKADRDYEDLDRKYGKLLDDYINNVKEFRERYEALLDRPVDPPPDGGINPR